MSVAEVKSHEAIPDAEHIAFALNVIRPQGGISLVSIDPKIGWPTARMFVMPDEIGAAVDWVYQLNLQGRNIYFTPNLTSVTNKKAAKADMTMATCLWSDCDPQVFKYKGYEEARSHLLTNLVPLLQPIASYIIDSGNGIDPFFVLDTPINIDGDWEGYEELNKLVGEAMEGPGTFNCDRVMRLPGTLNYPNDAKIKKGYPTKPSMARVIHVSDKKYSLSGIKNMLDMFTLKDRFKAHLNSHLAVAARYAGDKSGLADTSGSAMDFSMVSMLKLGGFTLEECRALLKDWKFGSSSDQRDTDRYWARCWERTSAKPQEELPVDISVFLGGKDYEIAKPTVIRETQIPDHLLSPPGVIGETMRWILSTAQTPQPILALTSSLALAATALANKVQTETGLRTNLYLVGVADTGSGKDHGRKCIKAVFSASGMSEMLGGEEIGSAQGLLSRVALNPTSIFQPDEFGLWLKSITAKNAGSHLTQIVTNLMKLFTSTGTVMQGTEYADQRARPRVDIHFPCVNVHATTTAEPLFDAFGSGDLVSGNLNRLLILFTDPVRPSMRFVKVGQPPSPIVEWVKSVRSMSQGVVGTTPESAIEIKCSTDAEKFLFDFHEFQQDTIEIKRKEGSGLHNIWVRAYEHVAKISLVVACAKHQDPDQLAKLMADGQVVVTLDDAKWAADFVKFVLQRMEIEISDRMADSEFGQIVKSTEMSITQAGPEGLTLRELSRNNRKFSGLKPQEQDAVLESLRRKESFFVVEFKTVSGRGKARKAMVASKFRNSFPENLDEVNADDASQ
jgi:hypothetical protein